jgi:hypothetical protein
MPQWSKKRRSSMATKAFGKYAGSSFRATVRPPVSPRLASSEPSLARMAMLGGRFGTASWSIGGSCAA